MRVFARIMFLVISFFWPLHAHISEQTKEKIGAYIDQNNHKKLTVLISRILQEKKSHLSELKMIAETKGAEALQSALVATEHYVTQQGKLEFSQEEFFKTAFFIERNRHRLLQKAKFYGRHETGLKVDLDVSRKNKVFYIVLDGWKSAYLGRGGAKTVYKAIAYGKNKCVIVARATQTRPMGKELKFTKILQGKAGVVETNNVKIRKQNGKTYSTLYSKLYNLGSLKSIFTRGAYLSSKQKLQIAKGALKGLETLHRCGIVHRDIAAQNIFINQRRSSTGKKYLEAVFADFGWANFAKANSGQKAQANTMNTAPEGLYFTSLRANAYYKTDIYALGLVFYNLVYGEKAPWKKIGFRDPYQFRGYLKNVIRQHHSELPRNSRKPIDKFKRLIFKMIDPQPHKRPDAHILRRQVEAILEGI